MTYKKAANHLKAADMNVYLYDNGGIQAIQADNILLNQVVLHPFDEPLQQIYLRQYNDETISYVPLLTHTCEIAIESKAVTYTGRLDNQPYTVRLSLHEHGYFYDVAFAGLSQTADLVFSQDLGLAEEGALRSNEAYTSQYIDIRVVEAESGYRLLAKQNQAQNGAFPQIEVGSFQPTVAYATDGFDVYGLSYKQTGELSGLKQPKLASRIYQYEMSQLWLQTETFKPNEAVNATFYVWYKKDIGQHASETIDADLLKTTYRELIKGEVAQTKTAGFKMPITHLAGKSWSNEKIDSRYETIVTPERNSDEAYLSFFTAEHSHVVTLQKELLVARQHGHVLLDKVDVLKPQHTLATTSWMTGVFNSQVVQGNTNLNKWLTHSRNPLNILRNSGQRIYLKTTTGLQLLTMPTLFEMGANYTRWFYQLDNDVLVVTNEVTSESKEIRLTITSENKLSYSFVITTNHSFGANEHEENCAVDSVEETNAILFNVKGLPRYALLFDGSQIKTKTNSDYFVEGMAAEADLTVLETTPQTEFVLTLQTGDREGLPQAGTFIEEQAKITAYYKGLVNDLAFEAPTALATTLNLTTFWYTHNMLVHYASPHGLEQYSGAAWGTRDVCQGPFEFFRTFNNKEAMKSILRELYSHQYEQTGDWPQWFMFDDYREIQQEESHGDIIVWPLKIIGDYLQQTGDIAFLDEVLPYTDNHTFKQTTGDTLRAHMDKAIATIESHFMPGTFLSNYGNGDWDDTLQPASVAIKERLVSSWTVTLTYQVFKTLAEVLPDNKKVSALAAGIKADFEKYCLATDDVIPGFLEFEETGHVTPLIHPTDTKTNISYRLIPLTRSIIAGLVSKEQAEKQLALIKKELHFEDGVRLMNHPAQYQDGISQYFKRAEQAANFGREVGLAYLHAHIRYVEALVAMGETTAVTELLRINPVVVHETVASALPRQRNAYFSSSDAQFINRYDAAENFDKLRTGDIAVAGGWRVYSSGPGIYLHQLISQCVGLRETATSYVFDPVLDLKELPLKVTQTLANRPVHISIEAGDQTSLVVNDSEIVTKATTGIYRNSGITLEKSMIDSILKEDDNHITLVISQ